jgi:hypothetical protein
MANPRGHGSVDVVDLRSTPAKRIYRIVQNGTMNHASCGGAAAGQCISNGRNGTWSPHDLHFSKDGRTMYVAAVGNDTVLVDVRNVLSGNVSTIGVAPNDSPPTGDVGNNPQDVSISHQSDVTSDGRMLVVTDERGGVRYASPSGHCWATPPRPTRGRTAGSTSTPTTSTGWPTPSRSPLAATA